MEINNQDNLFQSLIKDREVSVMSKGFYTYSGDFLLVMYGVRRLLDECIEWSHNVRLEEYPQVLTVDALDKVNYFRKFPGFNYVARKFKKDAFSNTTKENDPIGNKFIDHDTNCYDGESYVLNPSACYHTFLNHQNESFDKGLNIFLCESSCFRNEAESIRNPFRLHNFKMREIVVIGGKDDVYNATQNIFCNLKNKLLSCGVEFSEKVASDIFFGANSERLKEIQVLKAAKKELIFPTSSNSNMSCFSRNIHEKSLTKAFNIRGEDGGYLYSACLAVGVERMSYALLYQLGRNIEKWPSSSLKSNILLSREKYSAKKVPQCEI
ncbi:hypothetical protein OH460_23050 [Vibrio sp. Makdt]|uniref:aminoacyl--tRNA ligase-related protein n=1 Tax=Vibrio sp. Makdt TaxID=2998828 RepID=UPI0022CD8F6A|nr:aminoacyl--tRNA ligase-related protein [Vibrio sp. Makdt]MDA0155200.1 hypothetical protein [Vibrio sp. Makdt]